MPLPPVPPPPPGPPPLQNLSAPKLNLGGGKSNGDARGALLESIRAGKKLKKVDDVNDRSAPKINNANNTNVSSAPSIPSNNRTVVNAGPMNLGNLFANGIPKLRPTKGVKTSTLSNTTQVTGITESSASSNVVPGNTYRNNSSQDAGCPAPKKSVQNIPPRGVPPQPPPAFKKPSPQVPPTPSQSSLVNVPNMGSAVVKTKVGYAKPSLAPKPSSKPPPPPKSAQVQKQLLAGNQMTGKPISKPVLRTHSMISPTKSADEYMENKLPMRFLSRDDVHKSDDNIRQGIALKPAPPPPPPSVSRSSSTTIPNRTAPPRPPSTKPPPPPPVKSLCPNQAPPPPPHRTGPAPVPNKYGHAPPPPPTRNSSMKLNVLSSGITSVGKFENKYFFLPPAQFPLPDRFTNSLKTYRYKNGISKRPPAPQPPEFSMQLNSKMFAKNHSDC